MSEAEVNVLEPGMDAATEQTTESVDKIRDILFGKQIKSYEARFARLEEAVARDLAEMKEASARRLESLENFIKKEIDAIGARLKAERELRSEQLSNISRDLAAAGEALSKRILDLDDKTAEGHSGLRQDFMKELQKLLEEIQQKNDSLAALLERRTKDLHGAKLDRAAFASMLNTLALQVSHEPAEAPNSTEDSH